MLLEIQNVSKIYQTGNEQVVALEDASLSLDVGEFTAVAGPSGCGKTTLLLIAGGLLAPENGSVTIEGQDPYTLPTDERAAWRADKIGFVFQQFHLIPYLSVLDNILTAAIPTNLSDARDRAMHLIEQFGLEHRVNHLSGQLSTGEKQRPALARALLNQPKVLLADEPTGNLDRENAESVLTYLSEFSRGRQEGAVLLVTHDDHALSHAQRAVQIREGKLLREQDPIDVES